MDSVKISNFDREHPGLPFPAFRSLGFAECSLVLAQIALALDLPSGTSAQDALAAMSRRSVLAGIRIADQSGFSLSQLLRDAQLGGRNRVFLNWGPFDKIDEMKLADVADWFPWLWYPGPDDLEILDSAFEWAILISHEGDVSTLKLSSRQNALSSQVLGGKRRMAIELAKLKRAIDLALDLVESEEGPSIELEQDYYWEVDQSALYDPNTEPRADSLGQLSHDWERIEEIADGRMPAVGATLSWAGALLRALAHRADY